MHCKSENHLAAHYTHTGDNLSSLTPQWVASSPVPTSQWALSLYKHVAQPLNPQRSLHLLQTYWTFTQPMAANYMWAIQTHQKGQGATMTLANLLTTPTHVGDLIPPSCTTCHSIERNWNNPFGASVHLLQPKAEDTKPHSSAIMPNHPWKLQTKHLPLSVAISSIKYMFRNHSFGNMIRKCAWFISVIKIITSKKWYILDLSNIARDFVCVNSWNTLKL